jgi:hypothetical protein
MFDALRGSSKHAYVNFNDLMRDCAVRAMNSPAHWGRARGGILIGSIAGLIEGMKQPNSAKALLQTLADDVPIAKPGVALAGQIAPYVVSQVRSGLQGDSGVERLAMSVCGHPGVATVLRGNIEIDFPALAYPFVALGLAAGLWTWVVDATLAREICSAEVGHDVKQGQFRSSAELQVGMRSEAARNELRQRRSHSEGNLDRAADAIVARTYKETSNVDAVIRAHLSEGLFAGLRIGMSPGPRLAMLAHDSSSDSSHLDNLVSTLEIVTRWCGPSVQTLMFKDGPTDVGAMARTANFLWMYLTDSVNEHERARRPKFISRHAAARGLLYGVTLWEHFPTHARQLSASSPLLRQLMQFEEE